MSLLMQNGKAIGGGATLASELTAVDTEGIIGTAGNPVTGQALLDGLAERLSDLDQVPTSGSSKLVSSGGIYNYIDTMITQALSDSY